MGTAFDGVVYALYTALILTVGTVVWYGLFYLVRHLLLSQNFLVLKKDNGTEKEWMEPKKRPCANFGYLVLLTFFYGGLVIIVWLASATAGFNPWTSAAASLGLSVIATYALATPLGLIGSGFIATGTMIALDQIWEFHGLGPGWEGRIVEINIFNVTLARVDNASGSRGGELIFIPISMFLSSPCKRKIPEECKSKEECGVIEPTNQMLKKFVPKEKANKPFLVNRKVSSRYFESVV
ncbi:MAG: hypothetical protein K2Q45_03155 [Nitrosomonas sp.]|nr:hypothetical protein [Nitrosomonas sp.]